MTRPVDGVDTAVGAPQPVRVLELEPEATRRLVLVAQLRDRDGRLAGTGQAKVKVHGGGGAGNEEAEKRGPNEKRHGFGEGPHA